MAKDVVVKENNALATASMFDDFAGEGFGHEAASDFLIPRIAIVGDLSPQIKKNKAEYIEGCEVGDIVDVAMGEILAKQGETFPFLPVIRVKEVIEWKPRTAGGGIVSRNVLEETMESYASRLGVSQNSDYEYINKAGNELIETHQYYGLNLAADCRWSFIPMKKSNLKIARKWFTKATAIKLPNGSRAPLFYRSYLLGTFIDSGNGNEWANWQVSDGPRLEELDDAASIFESAKGLLEAVKGGMASGDLRGEEPAEEKADW